MMASSSTVVPGNPPWIEAATWRDLNALRNLERICFPKDAWPLWDLIGVLTLPNVVRLKAAVDGEMIGFVAGDERPSQHVAWIATIGVIPEHRGQGVGKALLLACEEHLKMPSIRLNVRISNQIAIQLYQNSGYHRAGIWPTYYQDGEDALIMEKLR